MAYPMCPSKDTLLSRVHFAEYALQLHLPVSQEAQHIVTLASYHASGHISLVVLP